MRSTRSPWLLPVLLGLLCGGLTCGGGSGGAPPTPSVQITLSPGATTLASGASQTFTAAVTGTTNGAVTWTVDGLQGGSAATGTLTGTGTQATYLAPSTSGSHTVVVTSAADTSRTASALITVQATVSVTLSPSAVTLGAGTATTVAATLKGTSNQAVTWSVDGIPGGNASVGTVTSGGTYTAPATAGLHTLVATSVADATRSASCALTVTAPASGSVTLSPASVDLVASTLCLFTATVTGEASTAVTWSVDGSPGGSASAGLVSGTGAIATYTAPAAAGSHTVTATSVADPSLSASASVAVQAPVALTVSLAPAGTAALAVSGSMWFTATVSDGTGVAWSVDGLAGGSPAAGTLSAAGTQGKYTAPAQPGSHTLTATSTSDPRASASVALTIMPSCAPAPTSSQVVDVTAAPYGAKGDGATDDTHAIQAAINAVAGTGGTVAIPAGTYLINPVANGNAGLRLGANMTLSLDPAAVLKAMSTSTSNYVVVLLSGVQNVNVLGGTILGNRAGNTITDTVEAGFGLEIVASSHVVVQNTIARACWADGFYVGQASKDITLCGVVADDNRRNGMSVTSVDGLVVSGSTFEHATGSLENGAWANGSGLDVEPNPGETVSGAQFLNCSFLANAASGLTLGPSIANTGKAFVTSAIIDGNTANGNGTQQGGAGIELSNTQGHQVTHNVAVGNLGVGIYLRNAADGNLVSGNSVTGTVAAPPPGDVGYGILLYLTSGNTVTGNTVSNCAACGLRDAYPAGANTLSGNTLSGNNPDQCQ